MAKDKTNNDKLTLVSATGDLTKDNPFLAGLVVQQMPAAAKLEKLNLPPLVLPKDIPIGGIVSGKMVRVITNFTGSTEESMRKAKVIHMIHSSGTEFLFPATGTIKRSMDAILDDTNKETGLKKGMEDRVIYFQRRQDGKAKKFGGKPMFMFDVALEKV